MDNNTYTNIFKAVMNCATIFTFFLLFTSCSKENDQDETKGNVTDGTVLKFSVGGIFEYKQIEINDKKTKVARNNRTSKYDQEQTILNEHLVSTDDFEVLANFECETLTEISDDVLKKAVIKRSGEQNVLTPAPKMASTVKYRILIFEGSTLVHNIEATPGTDPEIYVEANKTYRWYAFSVNEATVPNVDANYRVSKNDIDNKDFMYSTDEISTVEGENYLDILFERQMARIDFELNVRGLFGLITNDTKIQIGKRTSSSSFDNIMQTADYDILNGNFVAGTNTNSAPILGSQMTESGPGMIPKSVKKVSFLTVPSSTSIAANNLCVSFAPLKITLDNNTIRTFNNTIVPIQHSTFALELGHGYSIGLRLIESAIKMTGYSKSGTLYTTRWTRTNVVYNPSKAPDVWRLRPDNVYTPDLSYDYWNYLPEGGLPTQLPGMRTTSSYTAIPHPCARIYPEGTWRSVHLEQGYYPLGLPDRTIISGSVVMAEWDADADSPTADAYAHNNKLRLPIYGYRNVAQNGVLATNEGQYWASGFNEPSVGSRISESSYFKLIYNNGAWSRVFIGQDHGPNPGTIPNDTWGNSREGRCLRCRRQ